MAEKIDVGSIATLARLSFSEDEEAVMQRALEKIAEMCEDLPDDDNIIPDAEGTSHMLREDEAVEFLHADKIIASTLSSSGCYITVPRVIDKGDGET